MIEIVKISDVKANTQNPRTIKTPDFERLVESLKTFPQMLWIRPIAVNTEGVVLGGNMRTQAIQSIFKLSGEVRNELFETCQKRILKSALSLTRRAEAINQIDTFFIKKQFPIYRADNLTVEQQREFVIKDNGAWGEWNFDDLANDWDDLPLVEWGVSVPKFDNENKDENYTDDFELKDGDREPFQSMTFTFADLQAECIKSAIQDMKNTDEYKYAETMGNENGNGNALFLIVKQWAGQKK